MNGWDANSTNISAKGEVTPRPVIEWFKQQEASGMLQTMPIEISDRFHSWKMDLIFRKFMMFFIALFVATLLNYVSLLEMTIKDYTFIAVVVVALLYSIWTIEGVFLKTRLGSKVDRTAVKRLVKILYFETIISAGSIYWLYIFLYTILLVDLYKWQISLSVIELIIYKFNGAFRIFELPGIFNSQVFMMTVYSHVLIFIGLNFLYVFLRTRGVTDGFDPA